MKHRTKDFLSIAIPSLQLLMLGVLTAIFTANIDKFKAGIDESKMINELVLDLSKDSTKSNLKADFVLLSLERYLKQTHKGEMKEYDRDMFVGFAKSIMINRLNSDQQNNQAINNLRITREILLKYDPTEVNSFITEATKSDRTPIKYDTTEVKNVEIANPVSQLANLNKSIINKSISTFP